MPLDPRLKRIYESQIDDLKKMASRMSDYECRFLFDMDAKLSIDSELTPNQQGFLSRLWHSLCEKTYCEARSESQHV